MSIKEWFQNDFTIFVIYTHLALKQPIISILKINPSTDSSKISTNNTFVLKYNQIPMTGCLGLSLKLVHNNETAIS